MTTGLRWIALTGLILSSWTGAYAQQQTGATPDWAWSNSQASAYLARNINTAGDVNGDGYDDIIVGAHYYDNGQTSEGIAYVFHGGPGGVSSSPDWTREGGQATGFFGVDVSTAGDVNGDGFDDVLVGAGAWNNGQVDEGRAFLFYGSASGLSQTAGWTGEANVTDARFGSSVAAAGDVNNDGFDDFLVGARYYDGPLDREGRAYLFLGGAAGPTASGWSFEGNQFQANLGWGIDGAGDVNGDGFDDVIVSAVYYDAGQTNEGRVYVFHGNAGGLSAAPNWQQEGNQAGAYFGVTVAGAGDINGDGFDDVVIGASGWDAGAADEGRAFVYYGSVSGLATTPGWTRDSGQAGAQFGWSVGAAGDIDGDGFADLLVGAWEFDNGELNEGVVFVFKGSAQGLGSGPDQILEADQAGARFGLAVGTAGDVNGDGGDEILVGASRYDSGATDCGRAFLYLGTAAPAGGTTSGGGGLTGNNRDNPNGDGNPFETVCAAGTGTGSLGFLILMLLLFAGTKKTRCAPRSGDEQRVR